MKKVGFTVLDLMNLEINEHNQLHLKCICGINGLDRKISEADLNRPGLTLSGFFDGFQHNRIQIFGNGETQYLNNLISDNETDRIIKFLEYNIPCCIFTSKSKPAQFFLDAAEKKEIPVFLTDLKTGDFTLRISSALNSLFAPRKNEHATLMDIFGIGILIKGDSGIGKSETALELLERGHRLIADDAVELSYTNDNRIIGKAVNVDARLNMEIRGLGILDVSKLFGAGAVVEKKEVQLIVELDSWNPEKNYDRLGVDEDFEEFFDVKIPKKIFPIKPGRNIPILVEVAAMNFIIKELGHDSAREYEQKVLKWQEIENGKDIYYKR